MLQRASFALLKAESMPHFGYSVKLACSRRNGDFNIPDRPAAAYQMGCVISFTMLLFELLPSCYVSFYSRAQDVHAEAGA